MEKCIIAVFYKVSVTYTTFINKNFRNNPDYVVMFSIIKWIQIVSLKVTYLVHILYECL